MGRSLWPGGDARLSAGALGWFAESGFGIYNDDRVSDPRGLRLSGRGVEGRAGLDRRDSRVWMETSAPPVLERKRSLGSLLPVFSAPEHIFEFRSAPKRGVCFRRTYGIAKAMS